MCGGEMQVVEIWVKRKYPKSIPLLQSAFSKGPDTNNHRFYLSTFFEGKLSHKCKVSISVTQINTLQ